MNTIQSSNQAILLNRLQQQQEEQQQQLSAGKRINSAADDAAGLQVANRLTSAIQQSDQLSQNAQDQINLNNTAEAYVEGLSNDVLRAQELVIQSGNPLYDSSVIQPELNAIVASVNETAGEVLGSEQLLPSLDASGSVDDNLAAITGAFDELNATAAQLGAESNGLTSQVSTYQVQVETQSAARSRIEDADFAQVTSEQAQSATQRDILIELKKEEDERKGRIINSFV
ncbi:flagellin [Neiella marina]|uniref:Flagellin n=1 Tax=Neiella holothuriorum TaxID=2870530 RepID=A0ABS7EB76_9GAMM|nr:flagellin [Neiella holothuriorum]MBW8189588.1 flagellin [Neiella holothuriorum]